MLFSITTTTLRKGNNMAQVIATRVPSSNGLYKVTKGGEKLGTVKLTGNPGAKWEASFCGVRRYFPTKAQAIQDLASR